MTRVQSFSNLRFHLFFIFSFPFYLLSSSVFFTEEGCGGRVGSRSVFLSDRARGSTGKTEVLTNHLACAACKFSSFFPRGLLMESCGRRKKLSRGLSAGAPGNRWGRAHSALCRQMRSFSQSHFSKKILETKNCERDDFFLMLTIQDDCKPLVPIFSRRYCVYTHCSDRVTPVHIG